MPPSRPLAGRVRTKIVPPARYATKAAPRRKTPSRFGERRGNLSASPRARAAQLSFQGQSAQAGLRGVKVEIVVPGCSDQRLMDWAMRRHLRFFKHVRATVIATPPPFDHTKLCTVDGEWSLIGSSNWDARSFRLNFEFDLEIIDREFTAKLDGLIDQRIAGGQRITPDMLAAEPIWLRLRNAAARLLMPYL